MCSTLDLTTPYYTILVLFPFFRMRSIVSLAITLAVLLPTVPTAAAYSYMLDRWEDREVTRYNSPNWYGGFQYDEYIYASPYRSRTHSLHPYHRRSYLTEVGRTGIKITRPEFYHYLEDLYYDGNIGSDVPLYERPRSESPSARCYNYRAIRTSPRSPRLYEECY